MKIVFLDFDGVLNSHLYFKSTPRGKELHDDIDPEAVARLNTLCTETGAKIVVSSTWRLGRPVDALQAILDARGFKGEVIGKTEDMRCGPNSDAILRGNEVLQWIKAHPAECGAPYWDFSEYVILDDDSDFLYWQRNNLVLCDPFAGMTPQTVFRAKKVLGAPTSISEI